MTIKICYVQSIPAINGRDSLRGRLLVDHLGREFDVELIDGVVEDGATTSAVLGTSDFRARMFDVLYLEGGACWGTTWKVPEQIVREFVDDGGVLIAADVDRNEAGAAGSREASPYHRSADLFHAQADWGEDGGALLYGIDPVLHWTGESSIFAIPNQMAYDDRWLKPAYVGIDRVLVLHPIVLRTMQASPLATGNRDTSKVLRLDRFEDDGWPFTFASVNQFGLGFAVLIAGSVSHDVIVETCPDNARGISNIMRFLTDEASRERGRRGAHQPATRGLNLDDVEWASALGGLSELHNAVERRLRGLIVHRLLAAERERGEAGWATARIAAALTPDRRAAVAADAPDKYLERLYWLELVAIVKRDWAQFQVVFGDRNVFVRRAEIVNDRPHAHAKTVDRADVALYRRELEWFRSRLATDQ